MSTDFNAELQVEMGQLDRDAQCRVLEYARALGRSESGGPGKVIADFAGAIPANDLELMRDAIEKGCEQISQA